MLIIHYLVTGISALLTLTLFDSNPWWIVLIYSVVATIVNYWFQKSVPGDGGLIAIGQGIIGAFLAYLFGLTRFFRTTFGTLVGYSLLLALAQHLLSKLNSTNS